MIERITYEDEGLTEFRCRGALSFAEVTTEIDSFYSREPTPNVMWDITNADVSPLTGEQVRAVAEHTKARAHSRREGKTAVLAHEDVAFGLGRMYQVFAEISEQEVEVQVFRSREDALAWLGGGVR